MNPFRRRPRRVPPATEEMWAIMNNSRSKALEAGAENAVWKLVSPDGTMAPPSPASDDPKESNDTVVREVVGPRADLRWNEILGETWRRRFEDVERVVNWRKDEARIVYDLENRVHELEPTLRDLYGFVERRLEAAELDQNERLNQKWTHFEHEDKKFKELVRVESQVIQSNYAALKATTIDAHTTLQKRSDELTSRVEQADLRLAALQSAVQIAEQKLQFAITVPHGGPSHESASAIEQHAAFLETQLKAETEQRMLLQREMQKELSQLHVRLQEQAEKIQEESVKKENAAANRHMKIQRGVNDQMRQAELDWQVELSKLNAKVDQCVKEVLSESTAVEQRLVGRLTKAMSEQTRGSKELWEEHLKLSDEWRQSLDSFERIIDTKVQTAADKATAKQEKSFEDEEIAKEAQKRLNQNLVARLDIMEKQKMKERQETSVAFHTVKAQINRLENSAERLDKGLQQWITSSQEELTKVQTMIEDANIKTQAFCTVAVEDAAEILRREMGDINSAVTRAQHSVNATDARCVTAIAALKEDMTQIDTRVRSNVADATNHWQRGLQKIEFDCHANVQTQLLDNNEKVHAELGVLEQKNAKFREDVTTRLSNTEKKFSEPITSVDQKLEAIVDAHIRSTTAKLLEARDDAAKKYQSVEQQYTAFRHSTEERFQVTKEALDRSLEDVYRKLTLEATHIEKVASEMTRAMATHEEHTLEELMNAHKKWADCLKEQSELVKVECEQNMTSRMDKEKAERTKRETERLHSTQKRLQAHEDLMLQKFNDLSERTQERLTTGEHTMNTYVIQSQADILRYADESRTSHARMNELIEVCHRERQEQHEASMTRMDDELSAQKHALESQLTDLAIRTDKKAQDIIRDANHALREAENKLLTCIAREAHLSKDHLKQTKSTLEAAMDAHVVDLSRSVDGMKETLEALHANTMTHNDLRMDTLGEKLRDVEARGDSTRQTYDIRCNELERKIMEVEEENAVQLATQLTELGQLQQKIEGDLALHSELRFAALESTCAQIGARVAENYESVQRAVQVTQDNVTLAEEALGKRIDACVVHNDDNVRRAKDTWQKALDGKIDIVTQELDNCRSFVDGKTADVMDAVQVLDEEVKRAPWRPEIRDASDALRVETNCALVMESMVLRTEHAALQNTLDPKPVFAAAVETLRADLDPQPLITATAYTLRKELDPKPLIAAAADTLRQELDPNPSITTAMDSLREELNPNPLITAAVHTLRERLDEEKQRCTGALEVLKNSVDEHLSAMDEFTVGVRSKFENVDKAHRDVIARMETKAFLQEEGNLCADTMINKFLLTLSNQIEKTEERLNNLEGPSEADQTDWRRGISKQTNEESWAIDESNAEEETQDALGIEEFAKK